MRTLLIAGNWKMNPPTRAEATALAQAVKAGVGQAADVHVVLCPPAVFLDHVDKVLEGLRPFAGKGKVFHTSLSKDDETALRKAIETP